MFPDDLQIWLNHFEYHAEHPRCIPRGLSDSLPPAERRLIASSIATFQLGEQSEGGSLLRAAERFARLHRTPAVVRITELFIREEQRHAALLRTFMEDHQIPLKSSDWTDRVFRRVRRLAGLELYLYVLISAELIGNVYYRALECATGCQRLKVLCRTLVSDELAHIGFESQLLLALRARRAAPARTLLRLAHRAFFAGTAIAVWLTHRSLLRHCGYNARNFLRLCLAQYAFYLQPVSVTLVSRSVPRAVRRKRGAAAAAG
ncbi:MAG TPA: hypothetical protein VGP32_09535 [Steroidobacteraceae bacterium]|jgi:hypothetical protein|nr:hypothetical protein [Steroidobacteraceae bacterium]